MVTFEVRLTPRGGRDRVDAVDADGRLRVHVAAAPVDGAANRALVALVARSLDVPPSAVVIAGGRASHVKRLRVDGVTPDVVTRLWPGLAVATRD
jgi:uncharacterized protein YggU (UPF0235/DUF167 family)